jgi:hypothetical protein
VHTKELEPKRKFRQAKHWQPSGDEGARQYNTDTLSS